MCIYVIDKINMHKRIDICFLLKYQIKKLLLAVCEFDTFSLQLWFWFFLVIGFILEISHQYPQCLVCFCTLSTFHEHVINLQKVIHPNHKAVRVPKVCINSKSLTSFGIILCTTLFLIWLNQRMFTLHYQVILVSCSFLTKRKMWFR